jgi:rhodanese-related sulfurtransferase
MSAANDIPGRLAPAELKRRLGEAGEIALLDVREPGQYGEGHPFLAVPLPYSRLELDAPRLLPCRRTPVVLVDAGDGVAERAARRLARLGYAEIFALEGGAPAWAAAGYTLFRGVNVPSKTLGELVEARLHTPSLSAEGLRRMQAEGAALVQLDGRPVEEYRRMTVPGARCCPNAELAHRLNALVPDPSTPVVVSCAGRTRSIIGAQSLIAAGVPNPVFALENGTQGWELAGLELERGAERLYPERLDAASLDASRRQARRLIEAYGLARVDEDRVSAWAADEARSLYCLDVRTPEEFASAHYPLAESAPGGQLVQATDQWIAVRNARIALMDDTGLRAALTALWLRAMGHRPVVVNPEGPRNSWRPSGRAAEAPPQPALPVMSPAALRERLRRDAIQVIDLRPSPSFRRGHIAGARWSIRPRLGTLALEPSRPLALSAETPALAALAAVDLRELGHEDVFFLAPEAAAWAEAGLALEESARPTEAEAIDYLFFVHGRHDGDKAAMRAYLAWEQALVGQLDAQERATFDLDPLVERQAAG